MLDDTTQDAPASNEAQEAGLGIVDLRVFKEVIDVASARGAFKAEEFATIGDSYGRLTKFLQTIDAANAEKLAEATDGADEENEEATDGADEESTEE